MMFLLEATKVIWLSVLFLVGIIAMFTVVIAGFTTLIQIVEDIRDARNKS